MLRKGGSSRCRGRRSRQKAGGGERPISLGGQHGRGCTGRERISVMIRERCRGSPTRSSNRKGGGHEGPSSEQIKRIGRTRRPREESVNTVATDAFAFDRKNNPITACYRSLAICREHPDTGLHYSVSIELGMQYCCRITYFYYSFQNTINNKRIIQNKRSQQKSAKCGT